MIHEGHGCCHGHEDPGAPQGPRVIAILGKCPATGNALDPAPAIAAGCLVIGQGGHVALGETASDQPLDARAWNLAEIACRDANALFALGELSRELEALVDLADWQGAVIHRADDNSVDFSNPLGAQK
jgi:hypothetical protein